MKTRELKDLHSKTVEELKGMVKTLKADLLELALLKAQAKLKDTRSIFWKKKDLAKIMTIMTEKKFEKVIEPKIEKAVKKVKKIKKEKI